MATQEDHIADPLSDDAHVTSADGNATASPDALSLADLNATLGKEFKDKDTALKALKDTFSYVGKRKEDIAAELTSQQAAPQSPSPKLEEDVRQLRQDLFYSQNPQYKGYQALISKMGGDPAEVVASEEFKSVFEKAQAADEAAQKQSVVHSSSRLAETKSVIDDAVHVANSRGATGDAVAEVLARGILGTES